jgi:PAS domain S-box-containing protein
MVVAADAPRWTILDANEAYCAVTHHSRDQLIGHGTFDAFPESTATSRDEGAANVRNSFERAVASGARIVLPVQRYDIAVPGAAGGFEERYWELSSAPLTDGDGVIIGVLHEVEDATERVKGAAERRRLTEELQRRNAELEAQRVELTLSNERLQDNTVELELQTETLQTTAAQLEERTEEAERARAAAEQTEERISEIFRQAPAFIAILDGPEFVFTFANDAYAQIVDHRDIIGKPLREALPEVVEQGFVALVDQVYRTGEPFTGREVPIVLMSALGTPEDLFVTFVYTPIRDAAGSVTGIFVHGMDVTPLVRARQGIAASELQLRTMADAIPTLALTARADGYVDWLNARWQEYTGCSITELEGSGWQKLLPADVRAEVEREWEAAKAAGRRFEMTFPLRGADDHYRQFLTRIDPMQGDDGSVTRWFGTSTDVDAERHARALAEEANTAKMTFLATMSHELRTPLNALGGFLELLLMELRGPLTVMQRADLERMQRSHSHLLNLINDILNYAKIDIGHAEYSIAPVGVGDVLRHIEELVSAQCTAKGIQCELDIPDRQPMVLADEERLGQILLNLFSNAIKFTPRNGHLDAWTERSADTVRIHVRDSGIGIPADKLDAIFDPFMQVGRRHNSPAEGVGLGLAISKDLALGMGGTLTVVSTVGEGSTFVLTLPASGGE